MAAHRASIAACSKTLDRPLWHVCMNTKGEVKI